MSLATLEMFHTLTTDDNDPLPARWVKRLYYDPAFKQTVIGQLRTLGDLAPGWDGYRAVQISADVIGAAVAMVTKLPENIGPRPRVVPLASGGLQLEWHADDRSLEIEFENPGTIHYLRWHPEENIEDEDFTSPEDLPRIEGLIKWYARTDH